MVTTEEVFAESAVLSADPRSFSVSSSSLSNLSLTRGVRERERERERESVCSSQHITYIKDKEILIIKFLLQYNQPPQHK